MNFYAHFLRSRRGITLIELAVYVTVFATVAGVFLAILVSVTRVQVRQAASAEVNLQSTFLLQTIQGLVEQSAYVDMVTDLTTSTLKLGMTDSSIDPTYVYVSSSVAYLRQGTSSPQVLTSDKVEVTSLSFVKRANSGGKDAVAVNFNIAYASPTGPQELFAGIDTTIARVSAATFDSDIRASTTNTYRLGTTAQEWASINDTLFFGSASNIGIGVAPASSGIKTHISGGDLYLSQAGTGIVLKSTNSTCYKLRINNNGTFSTSSITCPD